VVALLDREHAERLALVEVFRQPSRALRRFHTGEAFGAGVLPAIDERAVVEDLISDRPVRADVSQTDRAGPADAVVLADAVLAAGIVLRTRFPLGHWCDALVAADKYLPNLALLRQIAGGRKLCWRRIAAAMAARDPHQRERGDASRSSSEVFMEHPKKPFSSRGKLSESQLG
jgi:hypothetical protein